VQERSDNWTEEKRRMAQWQLEQQHKYLKEIADLKTVFCNEIKVRIHMYASISIKFIITTAMILRACGSIDGFGAILRVQARRSRVRVPVRSLPHHAPGFAQPLTKRSKAVPIIGHEGL
jgi:hypothetical protein